jgi:hypothetical protein
MARTLNAEHPTASRRVPPSAATPPVPAGPAGAGSGEVELLRQLDRIRDVLERARALVQRGWLQHSWYVTRRPQPPTLLARLRDALRSPDVDEVERACLVAAVAVAAHGGGARPDIMRDAGPALDVVWDALWERPGRPGPRSPARAVPPAVRAARMRDLVRWNDAAGRSRAEVVALLDRAISRTILSAMHTPGRRPA